jgi:hypothetical protein
VFDSSMFESHHVSRHFEKRCQQSRKKKGQGRNSPQVNRRRARLAKRLPKLSLGVHAATHLILAAQATTGLGADHAHFLPLLAQAATRMRLDVGLADAGYDSESNHRRAREGLGIRTLIPATIGRPSKTPLTGRYRRLMRQQFKHRRHKKVYGQRWQVETTNSMLKRNLGSACRARTAHGRKKDLLLRAVTHNLMIVANL